MEILDSHVHFVDPLRADGVSWPDPSSHLFRSILPADLESRPDADYLCGCIAIETGRRPSDDAWLAELASQDDRVLGVVLNLQPDRPDFAFRLGKYIHSEILLGIRLRPIDAYDLSSDRLFESLQILQEHRKSVEFGARTQSQRDGFLRLANRLPDTTFILDHCGHPGEEGASDSAWLHPVNHIARLANTYCKITGEHVFGPKGEAIIEVLLKSFGPQRLIFGSNWPVSDIPRDFKTVVERLTAIFGNNATDIFASNARRAYGITTAVAVDTSQEYP